jgi:hypothetical protein
MRTRGMAARRDMGRELRHQRPGLFLSLTPARVTIRVRSSPGRAASSGGRASFLYVVELRGDSEQTASSTTLTGSAARGYLSTWFAAGNADVGLDSAAVARDARATERGDRRARFRLLSVMRGNLARAQRRSRPVVARRSPCRRPASSRRRRSRVARVVRVRARAPGREGPAHIGPASGRPLRTTHVPFAHGLQAVTAVVGGRP